MFNIANVGIKNKESSAFHKKYEKSHSKPGFTYKSKALKGQTIGIVLPVVMRIIIGTHIS
jgi:hypothetical protein